MMTIQGQNVTPKSQPRWGNRERQQKASSILSTLRHYTPPEFLEQAKALDIGCGSGAIAFYLAVHMRCMIGLDPEPWKLWANWLEKRSNLHFMTGSGHDLPFHNKCIDIIICNQVYEHVSCVMKLISEIYRVLKPGGYVYFAGPNLLFPIEPHVFWPFIHWIPRSLALHLMRLTGSTAILDAYSKDYWSLKRLLRQFEIINAIPFILKHPETYSHRSWLCGAFQFAPSFLINRLTWLSPGFVFILRKVNG